jgi:hypothetical protein
LVQISAMICGWTWTRNPAVSSSAASAAVRALPPPPISPTEVMPMWVRTAWAGPCMAAEHMLEPAATRAAPSTSTSASTLPSPFCSVIANPSGASAAFAVSAAARVLPASVQTIARSAPSPAGGLVVAGIRRTCVPRTPSRRMPRALMASTLSLQTSTKVTSCPMRDSSVP